MAETPSKRRRRGREAYQEGVDPMSIQPYIIGTWGYNYYLTDWLDGWEEAHESAMDHNPSDLPMITCPHCGKEFQDD